MEQKKAGGKASVPIGEQENGDERLDRFVLSVISLAFALKKLVESDYYDETRHKLVEDFTMLKNRVQLHTKILEQKEVAKMVRERQRNQP